MLGQGFVAISSGDEIPIHWSVFLNPVIVLDALMLLVLIILVDWCDHYLKLTFSLPHFQVTKPVPSLGVLAELWLEFPGCEAVAPTDPARVLLGMYPLLQKLLWSAVMELNGLHLFHRWSIEIYREMHA